MASEPGRHERAIFRLTLVAGLPGVIVSMLLLWRGGYGMKVQWTLGLVVVGTWTISALVLRERVVRPLQTLSNMLAALREGDYSIRARGADREDALGLAFLESNLLGETLRTQRLGAMEATTLLRTVMSEIDVAVFAFDDAGRVRLVNRAGERLLAQPSERLLGRTAEQVGLAETLAGPSPRTLDVTFPGARDGGKCGAARFDRTAGRTRCWSWRTSARRFVRRSCRRGSVSCGCSGTRSTTRWRRSSPSPAAWRRCSSARRGLRTWTRICNAGCA